MAGLTPFQFICSRWQIEPNRSKFNPLLGTEHLPNDEARRAFLAQQWCPAGNRDGNLHIHESVLFRGLWDKLRKGDVLLADRGFCSYAAMAALEQRGTSDALRKQDQLIDQMLSAIARDLVPERPERSEPRAKKRRPRNYQLLTKPRHETGNLPRRNRPQKITSKRFGPRT